eukprot:jgi/Tetstr1/428460/TSEL_018471.t1
MLPLVDDFLFLAPSREIALRRLRAMVDRMWGCLGLARHPTKAHPEPTQRLQHMGPEIDLTEMRFYGPPDCHARPRPALPRCPPPPPSGRAPATYFLSATLKPRSVASYCSSELSLFMDFYALEGASPLNADTPFIVRYISWAAKRGRNKAGAFQLYLSAVNTLFFRDHLREAVALGLLINQAVCGPKLALVDTRVAGIRVPLPADNPARNSPFGACGARKLCETAPSAIETHIWQLRGAQPGSWSSDTVTHWVTVMCQALHERPPRDFVWKSAHRRGMSRSAEGFRSWAVEELMGWSRRERQQRACTAITAGSTRRRPGPRHGVGAGEEHSGRISAPRGWGE